MNEENGFLLIAVTDEGRGENFFWKGEEEFACGPAGRKLPGDGWGQTRVAGVFPVDMPTRYGAEAKSKGDGLTGFDGGGLGDEVDRYLWGLGDGTRQERHG